MEHKDMDNNERIEAGRAHSYQAHQLHQEESNNNSAALLFTMEWDNSDVILVVNGNQQFHAHQSVLCLASPAFKTLLSNSNSTGRLEVDRDISDKAFELFLQFIYPQYALCWKEIGKNYIKELYELSMNYKIPMLCEHIKQFIEHRIKNLLHCKSTEVEDDCVLDQLEICDHIGFNQGLDYISKIFSRRINDISLSVSGHIQSCNVENNLSNEVNVEKLNGLYEKLRTNAVVRLETKLIVLTPMIIKEWNRVVENNKNVVKDKEWKLQYNLKKIAFGEPQKRTWILDISRNFHVFGGIKRRPTANQDFNLTNFVDASCDLLLSSANDKIFFVHSSVLSHVSPIFKKMVEILFNQRSSLFKFKWTVVKIDVSEKAVLTLLKMVYPQYGFLFENTDVTTLIEVCRLSKWLGIESIIKQINDQLEIELGKLSFDSSIYTISHCDSPTIVESIVKIIILADLTENINVFKKCTQICIENCIHISTFVYIVGLKELSGVGKAYFTAHVLRNCKIIYNCDYTRGRKFCNCYILKNLRKLSQFLNEILAHSSSRKYERLKNDDDIEVASEEDLKSIENAIYRITSGERNFISHLDNFFFQLKNHSPVKYCLGLILGFCIFYLLSLYCALDILSLFTLNFITMILTWSNVD